MRVDEDAVAFLGRNEDTEELSRCPSELSLARIPKGVVPLPRLREGESRVFSLPGVRPATLRAAWFAEGPKGVPEGALGDIGLDTPDISCSPRKSS